MHWIEEKFAGDQKLAEQRAREQELEVRKFEAIRSRGPEILKELQAAVFADVDKWDELYGKDNAKKVEVSVQYPGFKVFKRFYPAGSIFVAFDQINTRIEMKVKLTGPLNNEYEDDSFFRVRMSESDSLYLVNREEEHVSIPSASRFLIEKLTDI